jgi:hypothetical protein
MWPGRGKHLERSISRTKTKFSRTGLFQSYKWKSSSLGLWRGLWLERMEAVVEWKRRWAAELHPCKVGGSGEHVSYWHKRLHSKSPMSSGENFTLSFWVFPTGTMPEEGSTENGNGEPSLQWSMPLSKVLPVPWLSWSFTVEPGGRWKVGEFCRCSERKGGR